MYIYVYIFSYMVDESIVACKYLRLWSGGLDPVLELPSRRVVGGFLPAHLRCWAQAFAKKP